MTSFSRSLQTFLRINLDSTYYFISRIVKGIKLNKGGTKFNLCTAFVNSIIFC